MIEIFIVIFCLCFFGYLGYLGYILYRKKFMQNDTKVPLEDVVTQQRSSNDVFKDMRSLKYFSAAQWASRGSEASWSSSGSMGSDKTTSVFQPDPSRHSIVQFAANPAVIVTTPDNLLQPK